LPGVTDVAPHGLAWAFETTLESGRGPRSTTPYQYGRCTASCVFYREAAFR